MSIETFGLTLKKVRNSKRLTQVDVSRITGINTDSLRRIENGHVMPRTETIHALSKAYKTNLFHLISTQLLFDKTFSLYDKLDSTIFSHEKEPLVELLAEIDEALNDVLDLSDKQELLQMKQIVQHALDNLRRNTESKSIEKLRSAIQLTIPSFEIATFMIHDYTVLESRLLFYLSGIIGDHDVVLSTRILLHLLENTTHSFNDECNFMMTIIILANISANFHQMSDSWNTLLYAQKGIMLCQKRHSTYFLPYLLFRKGVCLMDLKLRGIIQSLISSVQILEIMGHNNVADNYRDVMCNLYGIHIEENNEKLIYELYKQ